MDGLSIVSKQRKHQEALAFFAEDDAHVWLKRTFCWLCETEEKKSETE